MNNIASQLVGALVTALIGLLVSWILLGTNWLGSSIRDKFWLETTSTIIEHLEITAHPISSNGSNVAQSCPVGKILISASCYSTRSTPIREEAAGGPVLTPNMHAFLCNKVGSNDIITDVAVCMSAKYIKS